VCRLAGLSILLIVCGPLILTSIKMDIVKIDIDKNIDRVRSAYENTSELFLLPTQIFLNIISRNGCR